MPLKLYQRPGSKVWYLRGSVRGQHVYETTGTEEKGQAEACKAKREAELFDRSVFGARAVITFSSAALSYLEFEVRSPRTVEFVGRLVDHFGSAKLSTIGQAEADGAVRRLLRPDAAPATKARAIYTPLMAVLTHAHKRGWCDRPTFERPAQPKGKTRWLTPNEALRLIAAAAPHIKPLLIFFLSTGARVAEALELSWDDVDLSDARVMLRDTKNGTDRAARLPPAAVVALANLPGRAGEVFRRDDGQPYADKGREEGGQIKTAFRGACRRAGLAKPTRAGERGMGDGPYTPIRWVPTLTPHDLRHTWATWFYAATKDFMRLKHEGGWKSLTMVERYAHLMPTDLVADITTVWGDHHPAIGPLPQRGKRAESVQINSAIQKGA
jgi:integrase